MARSNAKPTARTGGMPKAGKKKMFQEPPPPNPQKQEAREAGQRQFISKKQLSVPGTKVVFDKPTQQFLTKIVDVPVPFIYDHDRKQFVYSPAIAEKEEK